MASSKAPKKDDQTALQEALEEANELLDNGKKPKKRKRFRIFRDPLTGRRKSHYPYKPRFQDDRKRPSSSGKYNYIIGLWLSYFKAFVAAKIIKYVLWTVFPVTK